MILCVGLAGDSTFSHTLVALRSAATSFDVVEFAHFAISGDLTYDLDDPHAARLSTRSREHRLADYRSAYVRLHDISTSAPSERLSMRAAAFYLALGRLFTESTLPVINPPFADNSNFSKPYHAGRLAELGWAVPRSCVTNDPDFALAFIDSCGGDVIFKGVSSMKTWATRYEPARHSSRLPLVGSCPVLLQEEIKGPDIRVHVLGEQVFAEEIHSDAADYRLSRASSFRQIKLPGTLADRCRALVEAMGSPFLGVDLKRDSTSGEWLLLEANPMPGYEGYDKRAGGAISRALVDWLRSSSA